MVKPNERGDDSVQQLHPMIEGSFSISSFQWLALKTCLTIKVLATNSLAIERERPNS